jgi:hypothetical protein
LQPQGWSLFNTSNKLAADENAAPPQKFFVDFQYANGDSKTAEVVWKPEMHVQEAVRQSGGFRKFSRFDIELHRQLPQGGMHRMGIDFARSSQRVEPEFDYGVNPGDRIVIIEREDTVLDDAVNAVLSPLGLDRLNKANKSRNGSLPHKYRMEG